MKSLLLADGCLYLYYSFFEFSPWLSFSLLSKRTAAQLLFPVYCFVLGKVLALLGNGQICVLFYVLRISGYISWIHFSIWNYSVILLRQKVFLKTSHDILLWNAEDHHLTQITLKYLDCIRRCPIRAMAGNSPVCFFFTVLKFFSGCREKKHKDYIIFVVRRLFYLCCCRKILLGSFFLFLFDFLIYNSHKFYMMDFVFSHLRCLFSISH